MSSWTYIESQNGDETVFRGERSLNGSTAQVTGSTLEHVQAEAAAFDERLTGVAAAAEAPEHKPVSELDVDA